MFKSIHLRPKIVEKRKRLGDFEGDTVHFRRANGCKGIVLTNIDRVSKLAFLSRLESTKARPATKVMIKHFTRAGRGLHTLTLDRGVEFADHKFLEKRTGLKVYFADPYQSQQKGTIENLNGLIRQYLPLDYPAEKIDSQKLREVERLLNNRPRKSLGFKTPIEIHFHKGELIPQF